MSKSKKIWRIIYILALTGVMVFLTTFIIMCVSIHNLKNHEPEGAFDAIVVLGSGLKGDQVSVTLKARLDKAAQYILENHIKTVVVSGGQGPDEWVTEAFAMKEYLINAGVSEETIIVEDRSTSTRENFAFSKPLLDERLEEPYRILYVTNDFHCIRSGMFAKEAGFDADFLPAETAPQTVVPNYAREYLALLYYIILDPL